MIRLEAWSVDRDDSNEYRAPEMRVMFLRGIVTGHPTLADGQRIATSALVALTPYTARTASGRVYTLGALDPGYVTVLRQARERGQDLLLGVSIEDLLRVGAPS